MGDKNKKKTKLSMRERLLERKAKIKSQGGGGNYFTLKEGTNRYRNVPIPEDTEPAVEITHFYLGGEIKGYISPVSFGEPCAVMELHEKMKNSKKESDREWAKKFTPRRKFMTAVVRYKDEKGKEIDDAAGVKPLLITPTLYNEMIDLYLDEDEAGDFTDPENGYDLKYTKTGKGLDTEYTIRACKPTPLPKKYRKVMDIEQMVKELVPSYKESKAIVEKFLSIDPDEINTYDKGGEGKKDGKKKKKKKNRDI